MDAKSKERLKELIDEGDCIIIATNKANAQIGKKSEILTLLACTMKSLLDNNQCDKEDFEMCIEVAQKDRTSLLDTLNEVLEKLIKEMEEK